MATAKKQLKGRKTVKKTAKKATSRKSANVKRASVTKKPIAKKKTVKKSVVKNAVVKKKTTVKTVKKTAKKATSKKSANVKRASVTKKPIAKKKAVVKRASVTKKPIAKKKAVKKSVVKNATPKITKTTIKEFNKDQNRVVGAVSVNDKYFNPDKDINSKDVFGSFKIGSHLTVSGGIKNKINRSGRGEKKLKVGGYRVFEVDGDGVDIDYDLSKFSKSPHLVDLRDKNTEEIKRVIGITGGKVSSVVDGSGLIINRKNRRSVKKTGHRQNFISAMNDDHLQEDEDLLENDFEFMDKIRSRKSGGFLGFSLPLNWGKSIASFAVMCLIMVLPFEAAFIYNASSYGKGVVLGETMNAVKELKTGGKSILGKDLGSAEQYFSESLNNFQNARNELDGIESLVINILDKTSLDGGLVSSGRNLVYFGENISRAAAFLNNALINAFDVEYMPSDDSVSINNNSLGGVNLPSDILQRLDSIESNVSMSIDELNKASISLSNVNLDILGEGDRVRLSKVKEFMPVLIKSLSDFNELLGIVDVFLGKDSFKRYLVVFQNNYEIRATGGFIGGFALVDIDNGKIKNIEIPGGGSYDLQGGLNKRVSAPEPLYLVSSLWQFHDANWWPDFPTSANKLMEFYEMSGGPTVDGVIAITPQIIIDLLKISGPISMDEYGDVVTSENFMWLTEYNVELEYDKQENKPKKFLSDLCIELIKNLSEKFSAMDRGELSDVVNSFSNLVKKKDVQLYFNDNRLQEVVKKYELSGSIKDTDNDYLFVVNSNISGGKTDGVIVQDINLSSTISDNGKIRNKLIIKRSHTGDRNDYFQRVRNVNWMRIYVPLGSRLISANGFNVPGGEHFEKPEGELEIDTDIESLEGGFLIDSDSGTRIFNQFNKTVFANWSMVDVGDTGIIEIEYELPFRVVSGKSMTDSSIDDFVGRTLSFFEANLNIDMNNTDNSKDLLDYTLLVQKQPGIDSIFNYKLNIPDGWKTVWVKTPKDNTPGTLNVDKFFGKIFEVDL